jgi:hypothetical protein
MDDHYGSPPLGTDFERIDEETREHFFADGDAWAEPDEFDVGEFEDLKEPKSHTHTGRQYDPRDKLLGIRAVMRNEQRTHAGNQRCVLTEDMPPYA